MDVLGRGLELRPTLGYKICKAAPPPPPPRASTPVIPVHAVTLFHCYCVHI